VASFVDQYGFLATWLSCIILCYQLLVFLFEPNKFLLLLLLTSSNSYLLIYLQLIT